MPPKSKKDAQVQAELAALGQPSYVPKTTLEMDGPVAGIALKFDYSVLGDATLQASTRNAALDINMRRRRAALDIIEIGIKLRMVQLAIPQHFKAWIETEFDYSEVTARDYMAIADRFGDDPAVVADVPTSVLKIMSSATLPFEGVQAILNKVDEKAVEGETLTVSEARAIADQHRPEEAKRPNRRERIARTIAGNYSVQQNNDLIVKTLVENPGDTELAGALLTANKAQLEKALTLLPPDDHQRRLVLEHAVKQADRHPPTDNGQAPSAPDTGLTAPQISTRKADHVMVELPRALWGKIIEAFKAFDMNPAISDKDALRIVKIITQCLETQ